MARALNDTGKLGMTKNSVLQIQHDHLGSHLLGIWKNANIYRLLKQLKLTSEAAAGLYMNPDISAFTWYADVFKRPTQPTIGTTPYPCIPRAQTAYISKDAGGETTNTIALRNWALLAYLHLFTKNRKS